MTMSQAGHAGAGFFGSTLGGGLIGIGILQLFGNVCPGFERLGDHAPTCMGTTSAESFLTGFGLFSGVIGALVGYAIETSPGFKPD